MSAERVQSAEEFARRFWDDLDDEMRGDQGPYYTDVLEGRVRARDKAIIEAACAAVLDETTCAEGRNDAGRCWHERCRAGHRAESAIREALRSLLEDR